MKFKKLIALAATAVVICLSLTACGGSGDGAQKTAEQSKATQAPAQNNSLPNELTSKYSNYAESFTNEFGEFVNGDMDTVLKGVGDLNADNFAQWKETYDKYNERCEHWFNELSAAEMLCPEDKAEAHKDLEAVVATIQKIFEGLEPKVQAAEGGDLSQLTGMAEQYEQASDIAHEMWDRASAEVVE